MCDPSTSASTSELALDNPALFCNKRAAMDASPCVLSSPQHTTLDKIYPPQKFPRLEERPKILCPLRHVRQRGAAKRVPPLSGYLGLLPMEVRLGVLPTDWIPWSRRGGVGTRPHARDMLLPSGRWCVAEEHWVSNPHISSMLQTLEQILGYCTPRQLGALESSCSFFIKSGITDKVAMHHLSFIPRAKGLKPDFKCVLDVWVGLGGPHAHAVLGLRLAWNSSCPCFPSTESPESTPSHHI